jgi:hypothetical protein
MGGTCPVCGRYWNARGCTPGDCKSTPEPTPRLINESNVAFEQRRRAEAMSPTLAAINRASMVPEAAPCPDCHRPMTDQPYIRHGQGALRCPSVEHNRAWEKAHRPDLAAPDSAPFIASRPELGAQISGVGTDGVMQFAGVPLTEFCATDRPRIERMFREGLGGMAGMCASCTAKVVEANPLAPAPAAEHPAPWQWTGVEDFIIRNGPNAGQMAYSVSGGLVDGNGRNVVSVTNSDTLDFASARVRALLELAPDLEEFARACARHDAGDERRDRRVGAMGAARAPRRQTLRVAIPGPTIAAWRSSSTASPKNSQAS